MINKLHALLLSRQESRTHLILGAPGEGQLEGQVLGGVYLMSVTSDLGVDYEEIVRGDFPARVGTHVTSGTFAGDGLASVVALSLAEKPDYPDSTEDSDGSLYAFEGPITATRTVSDADVHITGIGTDYENYTGFLEADADLDADGYGDVLVGDFQQVAAGTPRTASILHGPLTSGALADARTTFTQPESPLYPILRGTLAGDVNGDGFQDLAFSDFSTDDAGAVWLFLGPVSGPHTLDEADGWLVGSTEPYDACADQGYGYCDHTGALFGYALAGGDLDQDGYDDLVIGAPGDETDGPDRHGPGAVYVYRGGPGGP